MDEEQLSNQLSELGIDIELMKANQLYGAGQPQLSLNTNVGNSGASQQLSPNAAAAAYLQAQQQPVSPNGNGYNNFAGYNMLGMGLPGMMNNLQFNAQMGNLTQQAMGGSGGRLPSLNLQIPVVQSPYSPAILSALTGGVNNGRTVYIGNLPGGNTADDLLNQVHFGPIENVRVLSEKNCVFISFLDSNTAAAFHADATLKKITLKGQELKIGWGKPSPVPPQVALAIAQSGASRNVYIGGLDEDTTEDSLRQDLNPYGAIDQIKILREKNIAFVHFLSIAIATKVVSTLPTDPKWAGKRISYGKDRCAYVPKTQQPAAQQAQVVAAQSLLAQTGMTPVGTNAPFSPFSPFAPFSPADALSSLAGPGGLNRTVYLGNIHPDTTTEDLCNAIRGGVLQSIRYMTDKHIAFVTFIDPAAAFGFFQMASFQGMTLNNRRLKIGWGKNPGAIPPQLALSVHSGATRNVYIGNIEDFETFTEEKLKKDFADFGEIELVNFLKEKNCAFVNYTNIVNAIKAIEGIKIIPEYASLRVAHGKDRCANPPRSSGQGGKRSALGNGPPSALPDGEQGQTEELYGDDGLLDDVALKAVVEADDMGEM